MPGADVKFIEERVSIEVLAKASSANEIVMLENRDLHKLFFEEIVWSAEAEKKRGGGLYVKTMELKPPEQFALKNFFKY